ncbi:uncharacterized protein LOC105199975 [Solenopsis invicta]|uniref:uncharacterized protein LOC105199975 n=1 Tax=Solenopsis invicta TaxID=13686 RepID=UPI0005962C61|nr:uncharacterized protein LOC105199975 [Solenopsis invicta]
MATRAYCIEIGDQRTATMDKCETRSRDISIPEFTRTFSCMRRPTTLTPLLNVITTKFCGGMRSPRQNFPLSCINTHVKISSTESDRIIFLKVDYFSRYCKNGKLKERARCREYAT